MPAEVPPEQPAEQAVDADPRLPAGLAVRTPVGDAEVRAVLAAGRVGFGLGPGQPEGVERVLRFLEPERHQVAWDTRRQGPDGVDVVAGQAGTYSLAVTVPGEPARQVPLAGVTMVSVVPTYRRQGVLTALLAAQLREVRDRGTEALAGLWASEWPIYGRHGYGPATAKAGWEVDTQLARFGAAGEAALAAARARGVVLRLVTREEAQALLPPAWEAIALRRPGSLARPAAHWERLLADLPWLRGSASDLQVVVAEEAGAVRGWAWYRTELVFGPTPAGTTRLEDLQAADTAVEALLWRHVLDLSLMGTLRAVSRPPDDALAWLLADARRVRVDTADGVWVRLVDVPRALAERGYSTPVDVVLEVSDPVLGTGNGRWRVVGDLAGAAVTPTGAAPDLVLGVAALGAAHLGGTSLEHLARGGLVEERTPGALRRAATAWQWAPAPYTSENF